MKQVVTELSPEGLINQMEEEKQGGAVLVVGPWKTCLEMNHLICLAYSKQVGGRSGGNPA